MGAGDYAFFPLVPLSDVDDDRALDASFGACAGTGRVDLGDLRLRLAQKFSVGGHCFKEYSDPQVA